MHITMNKNFDRLTLLYKIIYTAEFKNNASFILTESHFQMLPGYEDLIKSWTSKILQGKCVKPGASFHGRNKFFSSIFLQHFQDFRENKKTNEILV